MLYTINLVTTGPGKLSKSQQYRVTYNLPELFKVLRLMDIRGPLPHQNNSSPRSMPSSEHLPPVPFHKLFTRIIFFHLRQRNPFPRKIPEQSLYHSATIHRVGNHYAHIFIQANRTTIERFMMDCAQRQAIRYFTRAMMLLLPDMGCFKSYRGVVVAHIKAADRTLIIVSS